MRKSNNDYLNNENPDNPKITGNEQKVSKPYILCAAIWYNDDNVHKHQPRNIDSGFVVAGRRHHNCFITSFILGEELTVKDKISDGEWKITQGFITSDDIFLNREDAGKIAYDSGQTKKLVKQLFSEDLY
jgi:hypothetical protein